MRYVFKLNIINYYSLIACVGRFHVLEGASARIISVERVRHFDHAGGPAAALPRDVARDVENTVRVLVDGRAVGDDVIANPAVGTAVIGRDHRDGAHGARDDQHFAFTPDVNSRT